MNLIKKNICYFFLLVSFSIVSQVDTVIDSNKKTTGKTVILAIPSNKIKKPISLDIKNDNGFKKAYDKQKKEDAKKKKENMLKGHTRLREVAVLIGRATMTLGY